MYSLYFNNKNSKYDLSLNIETRPNSPNPMRNITSIEIPGRHGSLTEDDETYKDISLSVKFNFSDTDNINTMFRQIRNWLLGEITDNKLIFSDDTNHFYKVKYARLESDIERKFKILGAFTVVFICDPFVYEANEDIIEITTATSIYNNGYNSDPYLKVYGSGSITLTINSSNVILTNVLDYVEIDSEMMNCYKGTQTANNQMAGEFPIFMSGENTISWTGFVTKIEIIPRWRCL